MTFERPDPQTLLRAYSAELPLPVESVTEALASLLSPVQVYTDLLVVQGGWWYRAEYRVVAVDGGSRIDHELLNVASPAHWAGPITGRASIRDAEAAFARLVEGVRSAVARQA